MAYEHGKEIGYLRFNQKIAVLRARTSHFQEILNHGGRPRGRIFKMRSLYYLEAVVTVVRAKNLMPVVAR